MCIRTIIHNVYLGGYTDVSVQLTSCVPGYVCANPRVREIERHHDYAKMHRQSTGLGLSSAPLAYYSTEDRHIRAPSPLTPPGSRGSSGGSGSEGERSPRKRKVYFDGAKFVEVRSPRAPAPAPRQRATVLVSDANRSFVPAAPEPPRPIPIKRASTMPTQYGMETPPVEPTRGRRPVIIEDRIPSPRIRPERDVAPVVMEHASSGRRRSSHIPADLLHPNMTHHRRRSSGSPRGYGSAEDDTERRERRRRRREAQAAAAAMATSVPTFGSTDIYSSSYGSTSSAAYTSSGASSPVVGASPAVAAVSKKLRWEDQQRAVQNARISSRPKLPRSSTATGVQGEVKSILKNSGGSSPMVEPRKEDDMAELYRSVEGLNLHDSAEKREASAERRARKAEEKDSAAMLDRLRNRFTMPPRRFTAGSGVRRRTEIWYPDEGRYKYL